MRILQGLYQFLLNWLLSERPARHVRLSDFNKVSQIVRPGDVLLLDGRSRLDHRLRAINPSRWSQTMLYLGRLHDITDPALRATLCDYYPAQADTQLLIGTRLDQGLVLMPLSSLENEHLRICRPSGLGDGEIAEVIRYAISRLNVSQGSPWGAILLMLFPWALLPRRIRPAAFIRFAGRRLRNLTGGMVGEAFAFVQFPVMPLVKQPDNGRLLRRHPRTHLAADFDHSPYFEIIKYPFVDQQQQSPSELVPWQTPEDLARGSAGDSNLRIVSDGQGLKGGTGD